jgi:hypothetical protein
VSVDFARFVARHELLVGDDSVHQDAWHAIEGQNQDDTIELFEQRQAHERIVHQSDDSAASSGEGNLESRAALVRVGDLRFVECVDQNRRRGQGDGRSDEEREAELK